MEIEIMYPKNIDDLKIKINYILNNEQNVDTISSINNWLNWFNKLHVDNNFSLKNNEYINFYIDGTNYALQIWKHDSVVDTLIINKIANFNSIYNDTNTDIKI